MIEEGSTRNIAAGSAEVAAKINPEGLDAHYRFEYGTSTAYGSSVPVPDQDIGSGSSPVEVSQTISGLQPNTTYHFRVVATDADARARVPIARLCSSRPNPLPARTRRFVPASRPSCPIAAAMKW